MRTPLDKIVKDKVEPTLETARTEGAARNALWFLFPKLISKEDVLFDRPNRDPADETLRVSNLLAGGRYFDLGAHRTRFSASALRKLLSDDDPKAQIAEAIRWIEDQPVTAREDLCQQMTEAISQGKFGANEPISKDWFDALAASWPYFHRVQDQSLIFISSWSDLISGSMRRGLEQLDADEASEILLGSIQNSQDVSVLAGLVRHFLGDVRENGATSRSALFTVHVFDFARDIRGAMLQRTQQLAETRKLWSQADPWELVWFWHQAIESDDVKKFLESEVQKDDAFEPIVRGAINRVFSSSGTYERVSPWTLNLFIDPTIYRVAAENRLSSNEEGIRSLASRFLSALEIGENETNRSETRHKPDLDRA